MVGVVEGCVADNIMSVLKGWDSKWLIASISSVFDLMSLSFRIKQSESSVVSIFSLKPLFPEEPGDIQCCNHLKYWSNISNGCKRLPVFSRSATDLIEKD